ncbi:MAG: hypothetical protein WCF84_16870 [Anaerolineae bacterium]
MPREKIKATKLTVSLPFGIGQLEFQPDEVQQKAAWELYVELATRIAVQPLGQEEGLLSEALTSLYNIFGATRQILRQAGPSVAQGPDSFGPVAIDVLNKGLRPFLAKWHPLLQAYEQMRPADMSAREHERRWEKAKEFRDELTRIQEQMMIYADALAKIAGVKRA